MQSQLPFIRQRCTCSNMRNMQRNYRESLMLGIEFALTFLKHGPRDRVGIKGWRLPEPCALLIFRRFISLGNKISTPEVTASAQCGIR